MPADIDSNLMVLPYDVARLSHLGHSSSYW
jgi:hypothetical protein